MAAYRKSSAKKSELQVIPDEKDGTLPYVASLESDDFAQSANPSESKEEGQLSVDVFQTATEIVIMALIAGVLRDGLSLTITKDVLTIKGRRSFEFTVGPSDYFTKECFWGNFSRSIILPESVDMRSVKASFKNGILTIRVPKVEPIHTKTVTIEESF